MRHYLILFVLLVCVASCTETSQSEDEVKGIPTQTISDFVKSPVSADQPLDTLLIAKFDFPEPFFDFGTVDEGEIVEHKFQFKNNGYVPLVISNATSTCGCTVPEYPKEPIAPGESSLITVKFNTVGKTLAQTKPITIFANTYPNETKVYLKGYVKPKQE